MAIRLIATLDDPSGSQSTFARAINNSGQIAGHYTTSSGSFGFAEFTPGTITSFTVQVGSGLPSTVATGINDNQQIVGYSSGLLGSFQMTRSFIYQGGQTTLIGFSISQTQAYDINNTGQIVGTVGQRGFIYDIATATFTMLDDPSAGGPMITEPHGINDSGQIVGDFYDGTSFHSFLYSNGNFTTLDDPLAVRGTFAYGINNGGQIVGYYVDANGLNHGFLYSGGTYTTVDDPAGPKGTIAYGISDQGQIVGSFVDSAGASHGFLTGSPGPFNSDWGLVGAGDFNGDGTADLAWQRNSDHLVQFSSLPAPPRSAGASLATARSMPPGRSAPREILTATVSRICSIAAPRTA